jgi:hypothetical protein
MVMRHGQQGRIVFVHGGKKQVQNPGFVLRVQIAGGFVGQISVWAVGAMPGKWRRVVFLPGRVPLDAS